MPARSHYKKSGPPWTYRKTKRGGSFCKGCDRRINAKPGEGCTEKAHKLYYDHWKKDMRDTMRNMSKIPYEKWTGERQPVKA